MSIPYLVYGATGAQGGAVAKAILADGARVRIFSRKGKSNPFANNEQVELFIGDFGDAASLKAASQGVAGVYLVLPLNYDRQEVVQWGKNAIDAAVDAQAPVLVFNTSAIVADLPTGSIAIDIKVELEAYLKQARIPSVVLRPTIYLGNLTAPFAAPSIVNQGVLAYPIPAAQRVSWISWEDAAAYAVAALKRPNLAAGKPVYRIGGPKALTGDELATTIGKALGRPVIYVAVPHDQFEAGLNASFGPTVGAAIAGFYQYMTDPARSDSLNVDLAAVRAELPVPQTSLEAWANQVPWKILGERG